MNIRTRFNSSKNLFSAIFLLSVLFFINGCGDDSTKPNNATIPTITTNSVTGVTQTTAECGGTISSDGSALVTERGVCWCVGTTPTTADSRTSDGTGTGSFTSTIIGLTPGTAYYVRAYATNSAGTGYGSTMQFTALTSSGTVTDIDGNVYQTVTIGSQVWMAENLKVTHYRDGYTIPNVTDGTWGGLTSGAYRNYDDDINNVAIYGRLYNWYAVGDSRNIAPEGWHVPTDDDWKQLEMELGMSQAQADSTGVRGSDEGGKLKEAGTTHWLSPNTGATNESGFTALPGGQCTPDGGFSRMVEFAYFWSSTESSDIEAYGRTLGCAHSRVSRIGGFSKPDGFSVRCVQD